jgi:hypothetical protein
MFGTSQDTVKSAGEVGGGGQGRMREVEAEEGPATGFNFSPSAMTKASEMIAAAGGGTAGGMTKKGGGFRKAPGPWMAGPRSITAFAPTGLGVQRKEEDEIYG